MSADAWRDLEQWIPRLIAVWRQRRQAARNRGSGRDRRSGPPHHRRSPLPERAGPPDTLTKEELHEVAAGVRRLSAGLTRERELVGERYMDDPALLGAYLLFYWPVSYAQARSTLTELTTPIRSVLDLGSGPGPLAFAALDAGAREVVAADRSRAALELARALAIEAQESLGTREWAAEAPPPEGQYDLITLGHVMNEVFRGDAPRRADWLERMASRLKPGGTVLVLEPALRETSRGLLEVRDVLVERGFPIRAPCLFRGTCPALEKPGDWCHAEREWRTPALVVAIARAASLHKEALKMSYLAFGAKGGEWPLLPDGRLFRIVSEPLEGKGRQRFMGCGPEGRLGLALQDKHRTDRNRRFTHLERGEVIRVDRTEPRGDGLALTDQTTLETVALPGRPLIAKPAT